MQRWASARIDFDMHQAFAMTDSDFRLRPSCAHDKSVVTSIPGVEPAHIIAFPKSSMPVM